MKKAEVCGRPGKSRTVKVNALARVEGEGAMVVKIREGKVAEAKFGIFEPPRFFEALLRGRSYTEPPDITARICGICPVAYQMSACHAIESACGVRVEGVLRDLRRLLYCGEWIQSHALHIFMLHAPDFLGYQSSFHMAADYPDAVNRGLRLKKAGNSLLALLGGRAVHPVNVRVGGFYRVPDPKDLKGLAGELEWARDAALETVHWTGAFDFPSFDQGYEFVSLCHPEEYPMNEGRLVSSKGLDVSPDRYEAHFSEQHLPHSTALHSTLEGRVYVTGPLARYNLNFEKLSPAARTAAREAGLDRVVSNPFRSIVVRSVEMLHACEEALRLIAGYEMPEVPCISVSPREGTGYGCTEAPRGILYHRYTLDRAGFVTDANIVPPTSQNQKAVERDLFRFAAQSLGMCDESLKWHCEQAIRNYDPCISCATHHLDLRIERE